jgi:hypothetical protein
MGLGPAFQWLKDYENASTYLSTTSGGIKDGSGSVNVFDIELVGMETGTLPEAPGATMSAISTTSTITPLAPWANSIIMRCLN